MYIKPFEYSSNSDFMFRIDVVSFKINLPEDIEIDIWMSWMGENGKCCKMLMPESFPDYKDKEVIEYAIDKAQKAYYDEKIGF